MAKSKIDELPGINNLSPIITSEANFIVFFYQTRLTLVVGISIFVIFVDEVSKYR